MEIGAAPEISLDVCYMSRIRDLALSRRMREFFDANMGEARVGHPLRRQHMAKLLPWLNRRPTLTNDNCEEMKVSCRDRSSIDATQQQQQEQQQQVRQLFLGRLTRLKRLAVTTFEQWHNRSSGQRQGVEVGVEVEVEVETKGEGQSLARMRGHNDEVGIDLDAFLSMVQTCDLPELASRQVFEIFDIDGSGIIRYRTHPFQTQDKYIGLIIDRNLIVTFLCVSLREFLFSVLALQDPSLGGNRTTRVSQREALGDESMCRFFFAMMDLNDTGFINKEELRTGLAHLLLPSLSASASASAVSGSSVDDLFAAIDSSQDGKIQYDEFKLFYISLFGDTIAGGG
jgi:Ca2+-binding EF-hand superfamily protein